MSTPRDQTTFSDTLDIDVGEPTAGALEELATHKRPPANEGFLDVNLLVDGRQHGHLILPRGDTHNQFDQLRLPLSVLRRGEGPVILLLAGVHGDEYEGPVTLHRLATELDTHKLSGTVIIAPSLNLPALVDHERCARGEQLDLDTQFPDPGEFLIDIGHPSIDIGHPLDADHAPSLTKPGRIAAAAVDPAPLTETGHPQSPDTGHPSTPDHQRLGARIARAAWRELIEPADWVIDLRSGGSRLQFVPMAAVRHPVGQPGNDQAEAAMIAFGAPNAVRLPWRGAVGSLAAAVTAAGKRYIQTELGGGGTVTAEHLAVGYTGCLNLLSSVGVLNQPVALRASRMLEVRDEQDVVRAPAAGLIDWRVRLGHEVWAGNPMAHLIDPTRTGAAIVPIQAPRDGILLAVHHGGHVNAGDCVAILANEVQR